MQHKNLSNLPPELQKLHELYPDLDYDQLEAAAENLRKYVEVAMKIHDRLSKEGPPEDDSSNGYDINTAGSNVEKNPPAKMG